jgi:hypothetical protein
LPSKICRLDLSFSLDVWCRSKWEKNPWKPKKIIYEPTDEKLTATAGLGPLIDAFMQSPEFTAFKACLPERIGNSSYSAEHLALIVLCGFWYGHDCLDDLEEFEHDPVVEDKLGGPGDLLEHIQRRLTLAALSKMSGVPRSFIHNWATAGNQVKFNRANDASLFSNLGNRLTTDAYLHRGILHFFLEQHPNGRESTKDRNMGSSQSPGFLMNRA